MESGLPSIGFPLIESAGLTRPQAISPFELLAACGHALWATANGREVVNPSDVNLTSLETTPAGLRGWANYWHIMSSTRAKTKERSSSKDKDSDGRDNGNAGSDNSPGASVNCGSIGVGDRHWTVYATSRLGRYSATWTEVSRPSTEAIRAWLAEDMNMPLQNIRLRTELGHMCTHVEVFPRLSGGGPKRKRRGKPSHHSDRAQERPGGQNPTTSPTHTSSLPDTPATWTVMQANAHGYIQRQGAEGLAGSGVDRAKAMTLEQMLIKHTPAFVCITETWMRKSDGVINVPGYRCYSRPRENRRGQSMAEGGTAILVTNEIPEDRIEVLPHIEEGGSTGTMGICATATNGKSMYLFTTYSETEGSPITEHLNMNTVWKRRTEAIKTCAAGHMDSPVIWCGDFNVHIHDAPDCNGRVRVPLPHVPSSGQRAFAKPFLDAMATNTAKMTILNGLHGGVTPTWYPGHAMANGEVTWDSSHRMRPSVLDLFLIDEEHEEIVQGVEVITAGSAVWSDHRPVLLHASNTHFPLLGANDAGGEGDQTQATFGFGLPKDFEKDSAIVNALQQGMERFTTEWASDHDELLKAEATDPLHLETGLVDSVYAQFIGGVQTAVDTVAKGCRSKRGTDWATFDWQRTARSHVGELICKITTVKSKPKEFPSTSSLQAKMRDALAKDEVDIKTAFATADMLRGKEPRQQRVWAVQNDSGALVTEPEEVAEAHRCRYIHLGEERDPITPTTEANDKFRDRYFASANRQTFDSTTGRPPPAGTVANYSECLRQLNRPFVASELRDATGKCNKSSATGEDGVPMRVLAMSSDNTFGHMAQLANALLNMADVPSGFKSAIVTLLPKKCPNKYPKATRDRVNYRGISVTNSMSKIIEKAIETRLTHFIAQVAPFSKTQMGFRANMWATLQVQSLLEKIAAGGKNFLVLFFDLTSAYPSCRRSSLLKSLYNRGVAGPMLRLIGAFYRGTTAKIRCGGSLSSTYQIVNGLKEGSVLSCVIFLSWICDLMDEVHRDKTGDILGYADDICALPHRPYTQAQAAQMQFDERESMVGRVNPAVQQLGGAQAMLDQIGAYGYAHMMSWGWLKCAGLLCNPDPDHPSYPGRCEFHMVGMQEKGETRERLRMVTQYEYLGMIMHESLSWAPHISTKVIPKVASMLWSVERVATYTILPPKASLKFIDALVLAYVRYGCALWGRACWCTQHPDEAAAIVELTQLFKRMIRRVVGVDYSLASFTAVAIELAWLGVEGEIVLSQLRMYRSIMALDDDREEKVRLRDDMARVVVNAEGRVTMPAASKPTSRFRMTHLFPCQANETIEVPPSEACKMNEEHRQLVVKGIGNDLEGQSDDDNEALDRMKRYECPYGTDEQRERRDALQAGPNLPSTCKGSAWQRIRHVVGHTPAHAVAAGNCGGYTISDLKWDLKHGYLVVPNLESTANPNPEADAFAEAGRAQTARRPGNMEHYLPHQYWIIKQSPGGGPKETCKYTTLAASLVACFQTIGGGPLRNRVRETTTPLAGKGKFKRVVLEAAKYAVARRMWTCILAPVTKLHKDVARNFTARRLKTIVDTAGPDLVWRLLTQPVRPSNATDDTKPALFSALSMSPHLASLPICLTPGMVNLGPYLVVKCRVGAIPTGNNLDRRNYKELATSPPFCPAHQLQGCGDPVEDSLAHHLTLECPETATSVRPPLFAFLAYMERNHRYWMQKMKALADPHAMAAEMLQAADMHPDCTPLLLTVLKAIVTAHPLCRQQKAGQSMAMVCYRTKPYNKGAWTDVEVSALATVTQDMGVAALAKAVPSRTPGATRNKWRRIHGNAPETATSNREELEGAVEDSVPR